MDHLPDVSALNTVRDPAARMYMPYLGQALRSSSVIYGDGLRKVNRGFDLSAQVVTAALTSTAECRPTGAGRGYRETCVI